MNFIEWTRMKVADLFPMSPPSISDEESLGLMDRDLEAKTDSLLGQLLLESSKLMAAGSRVREQLASDVIDDINNRRPRS